MKTTSPMGNERGFAIFALITILIAFSFVSHVIMDAMA